MKIGKVEEKLKEQAAKVYKEDLMKLDKLVEESDFGRKMGFESGRALRGLGVDYLGELRDEYEGKFVENEVDNMLGKLEGDNEDKEEYVEEYDEAYETPNYGQGHEGIEDVFEKVTGTLADIDKEELDRLLGLAKGKLGVIVKDTKEGLGKAKEKYDRKVEDYRKEFNKEDEDFNKRLWEDLESKGLGNVFIFETEDFNEEELNMSMEEAIKELEKRIGDSKEESNKEEKFDVDDFFDWVEGLEEKDTEKGKSEIDKFLELLGEIEEEDIEYMSEEEDKGYRIDIDIEDINKALGLAQEKVSGFLGKSKDEFIKAKDKAGDVLEDNIEKYKEDYDNKKQQTKEDKELEEAIRKELEGLIGLIEEDTRLEGKEEDEEDFSIYMQVVGNTESCFVILYEEYGDYQNNKSVGIIEVEQDKKYLTGGGNFSVSRGHVNEIWKGDSLVKEVFKQKFGELDLETFNREIGKSIRDYDGNLQELKIK